MSVIRSNDRQSKNWFREFLDSVRDACSCTRIQSSESSWTTSTLSNEYSTIESARSVMGEESYHSVINRPKYHRRRKLVGVQTMKALEKALEQYQICTKNVAVQTRSFDEPINKYVSRACQTDEVGEDYEEKFQNFSRMYSYNI